MDSHYYQHSRLVPFSPQHPAPPSGYLGAAANPEGYPPCYNTDWGQADEQALLVNATEVGDGGMSTALTASAASMTTHHVCQCHWSTDGVPCRQGFENFDKLMEHIGLVHEVRGSAHQKLVCQWWDETGRYCGQKYRRDAFRRHIGTHVHCRVLCPTCGRSFSRKDSMRAHWKKQHGKK